MFSENQWLFIFAAVCALEASVSLWRMVRGVEKRSVEMNPSEGSTSPYPRRWVIGTALGIALSLALSAYGFYRTSGQTTSTAEITDLNAEAKVHNWLDSFSLTTKKLDSPDCYFIFQVTTETGVPLFVMRSKSRDHYVTFQVRLALDDYQLAAFKNLKDEDKQRFFGHLTLEAAKAKAAYEWDVTHNGLVIERRVPIGSGLNEAVLLDNIEEVNFSSIIVLRTINELLGKEAIKQPLPTPSTKASPH
jgi:hypothetical protein